MDTTKTTVKVATPVKIDKSAKEFETHQSALDFDK
jgi:hypothetical protein